MGDIRIFTKTKPELDSEEGDTPTRQSSKRGICRTGKGMRSKDVAPNGGEDRKR